MTNCKECGHKVCERCHVPLENDAKYCPKCREKDISILKRFMGVNIISNGKYEDSTYEYEGYEIAAKAIIKFGEQARRGWKGQEVQTEQINECIASIMKGFLRNNTWYKCGKCNEYISFPKEILEIENGENKSI